MVNRKLICIRNKTDNNVRRSIPYMFVYEEIFNKPYFLFFALFLYELHQCVWHQISYYSWMNYEASCTNYMYYLMYSFFIFQLPGQNIPRYRDKSVKPHENTKH